jgi:hypothetical protein
MRDKLHCEVSKPDPRPSPAPTVIRTRIKAHDLEDFKRWQRLALKLQENRKKRASHDVL